MRKTLALAILISLATVASTLAAPYSLQNASERLMERSRELAEATGQPGRAAKDFRKRITRERSLISLFRKEVSDRSRLAKSCPEAEKHDLYPCARAKAAKLMKEQKLSEQALSGMVSGLLTVIADDGRQLDDSDHWLKIHKKIDTLDLMNFLEVHALQVWESELKEPPESPEKLAIWSMRAAMVAKELHVATTTRQAGAGPMRDAIKRARSPASTGKKQAQEALEESFAATRKYRDERLRVVKQLVSRSLKVAP